MKCFDSSLKYLPVISGKTICQIWIISVLQNTLFTQKFAMFLEELGRCIIFLFILWQLSKLIRIPSSMNKPWLRKIWGVLSSSQACCGDKVKGKSLHTWRKRGRFWPWNFTLLLTLHLSRALLILLSSNHIKYSILDNKTEWWDRRFLVSSNGFPTVP